MSLYNPAMIKVITFDLDDTFWDIMPVIRRADERVLDWFAVHAPRLLEPYAKRRSCGMREELMHEFPDKTHDLTFLWKESLRRMARQQGLDPSIAEPAFEVYYAARNDVILYSDVMPVLEQLHGEYRLGVLSNGNASVERVGIRHWFDFVLSAESVGAAKPHPLMFQQAVRVAGVPPRQIAHVGDHWEHDVKGAHDAGLHTVWVNRNGDRWPAADFTADAEIADLNQLPAAIDKINAEVE